MGITRAEAELLFDLNDATIEVENELGWSDLFVKAIACSLMAHLGYTPTSREEALRRSERLDDHSVSIGHFMKRMFRGGFSGIMSAYPEADSHHEQLDRQEEAITAAVQINEDEVHLLAECISRDGLLHENEKALIVYMETLGARLSASLGSLIPPKAQAS